MEGGVEVAVGEQQEEAERGDPEQVTESAFL